MPRRSLRVMPKMESDSLPEWATEFVVLTADLEARGILSQVDERLAVSRRDGYCSLDVFLFLLAYFSSGLRIGLRPFAKRCAPHASRLAAVGGRRLWPSSSSVSRFLSSVTNEQVNGFGTWLLSEAVAADHIESHPSIVCRDTQGESWHAFDYDPTITTLRHRALPAGEDLPEPQRRSSEMAAKGYHGRKRGNVQFSRATLQHAGSGLWVSLSANPGNGDHRRDFERAVSSIKAWCMRTGVDPERAVMRSDGGAGGGVPAMTACREADIHFMTRLSRYEVLGHAKVKDRLNSAVWSDVEDSLSGPRRQATELGTMLLSADRKTKREDGKPYSSIETRIVASRTAITEESRKRGAGIEKDGWWYELYGTSLPASSWPAPEAVSLYYGRTGQENRFCQEDRELGLDRIFSYDLPGQELANLIGLFVWNLRTARGADLVGPMPEKLPVQSPRMKAPTAAESVVDAAPPAGESVEAEQTVLGNEGSTTTRTERRVETEPVRQASPTDRTMAEPMTETETPVDPKPSTEVALRSVAGLVGIDWSKHLERLPGWQWDETHGLTCPRGTSMRVHAVANVGDEAVLVRLRAQRSVCRDCPVRSACSRSQLPSFRKEVWLTFDRGESPSIAALAVGAKQAHAALVQGITANMREANQAWRSTPGEQEPGALAIAWPILVPSELRHYFTSACGDVTAEVKVEDRKRRPARTPFYFATTAAARQRRRKTWKWRRSLNQLPDDAQVDIALNGATALARLLSDERDLRKAA